MGDETSKGSEFSVGGVFSFLKLDLKASGAKKTASSAADGRSGERFHSPGSLLNRLRRHLRENDLLRRPDWEHVKPSEFIEFRGVFRPNPLTEALTAMKRIMELLKAWPQFKNQKKGEISFDQIVKMVEALLKDLEGAFARRQESQHRSGEAALRGHENSIAQASVVVLAGVVARGPETRPIAAGLLSWRSHCVSPCCGLLAIAESS